jgi:hypothetical protein
MAYISSSEEIQTPTSLGCCAQCQCGRQAPGSSALSQWYERDEGPPHPVNAAPSNNRPGSSIGEYAQLPDPPRLVLQTPGLWEPDPTPPLLRRLRGILTRDMPPLTLGPIAPPIDRRDLFRLSPEFQRGLQEKWDRERKARELFRPLPPPPPTMPLSEAIERFLNHQLDRLLIDLRVPPGIRGHIRDAARAAIGRGAEELLDRSLTQTKLSPNAREAIKSSVRAAMQHIRVPSRP